MTEEQEKQPVEGVPVEPSMTPDEAVQTEPEGEDEGEPEDEDE